MADTSRLFKVGETVRLRVRVAVAGTRQALDPVDPVVLTRLDLDGIAVALPTTATFDRMDLGLYELALDSTTYAPGTYHWMARVSSGSQAVSLPEDAFVLTLPDTAA